MSKAYEFTKGLVDEIKELERQRAEKEKQRAKHDEVTQIIKKGGVGPLDVIIDE